MKENAKIKDPWSSLWLNVENIIRYDRNVMTYKGFVSCINNVR